MSRSFKKVPIVKLNNSSYSKKQANKRVRKYFDLSNGNNYRKLYDSYDICDWKKKLWKTHGTIGDIIYGEFVIRPMTIEEIQEYWRK